MPNRYPPGKEPLCPICGVTPLKTTRATQCHACYLAGLKAEKAQRVLSQCGVTAPSQPAGTREPLSCYDEAWHLWQREIGMARDRYAGPCQRPASGERIAVISDLHVPFHEPGFLADFIAREAGRTDLLVINGDLSDAYSLSRFVQYEHMPFREEWAAVTLILQQLSESFPRILLGIGNHDARLEKQILSRVTADMADAIRWMTGGTLCPLTMLASRLPNVEVFRHTLRDGHTVDWFTTVGDAWVGHPEAFSVVPTGATRKVEQALATKADEWELDDIRLIIIGHTHQAGLNPWRGALLAEGGCLCRTQGYQTSPRIGVTAQRRGWLTFEQHDGITDLNSVRFHNCDWEMRCAA